MAALVAVKGISPEVSPESSLVQDLGFESMDMIYLAFEIERTTGVVVELNQLTRTMRERRVDSLTVQDLVDFLETHG